MHPAVGKQVRHTPACNDWSAVAVCQNWLDYYCFQAKEEAKDSLRAKFGTDGSKNACHGRCEGFVGRVNRRGGACEKIRRVGRMVVESETKI
jgi:hypothetical protein